MTSESHQFEPSEDYLILQDYILQIPSGTPLSWLQIQQDTGILMDQNAKQKFRRVLERHRIEWHPLRGYGLQLANADLGTTVVARRLCRTYNSIVRTGKSSNNILDRFRGELHPGDRERIENTAAASAAMQTYAKGAKKLFAAPQDQRDKQVASEAEAIPVTVKGRWCR